MYFVKWKYFKEFKDEMREAISSTMESIKKASSVLKDVEKQNKLIGKDVDRLGENILEALEVDLAANVAGAKNREKALANKINKRIFDLNDRYEKAFEGLSGDNRALVDSVAILQQQVNALIESHPNRAMFDGALRDKKSEKP